MTYIVSGLLVLLSGLFSGLTIGLMSLNKTELQRKIKLGDKSAKKVYAVRKNGNFLLTTLLVGNVAVNATISILLESIAGGLIAGVISTFLIVIFGEIIPQALFSRYALETGERLVFLVRLFMIITFPISYPIAWLLDKALGDEIPTVWSKAEIKEIVKFHKQSDESDIDEDEERIVIGALSFSQKRVKDILTPKDEIFALQSSRTIDDSVIQEIKEEGFTRIPVYEKNEENITSLLYAKDLIGEELGAKKVSDYARDKNVFFVYENKKLDSLLNQFIQRKSHLAVVLNNEKSVVGIVSLEDVVEEILETEILDELD